MKAVAVLLAASLYCQWISSFPLTTTTAAATFHFKVCQSYEHSDPTTINFIFASVVCKNAILQPGKKLSINIPANSVKYVIFKNNILPHIPLGTFAAFPNVTHLYLNNNGVKTLTPGLFTDLPQLQELYLQHNRLTAISTGTFITSKNLIVLDLSKNAIIKLENGCFTGLDNLKSLNLNRNSLFHLEREVLTSLTKLERLDLSHNFLTASDPFFVIELMTENLKELYINNNLLVNFPIFLTNNLNDLELLDVSFNNFTKIDLGLLLASKIANLSNNQISVVKGTLEYNNSRVIDLQKNEINYNVQINGEVERLDLRWNKMEILNSFIFNTSDKVKELDLGHNVIQKIINDYFYGLTNLQTLRLNDNKLTALNVDCFAGLDSLDLLSLSHNFLTNLEDGVFDGLLELRTLYLDYNKLISVNKQAFRALYNLQNLYLNNNLLTTVNIPSLLTFLPNLKTISLHSNNWNCYEMLSNTEAFMEHSMKLSRQSEFGTLTILELVCDNFHIEVYAQIGQESLIEYLDKAITSFMLLLVLTVDMFIICWYFMYLRMTLIKSQAKMRKFEHVLAKVKTNKGESTFYTIL